MIQELNPNIRERVREKKDSYHRYNFERLQEEAFATFFDLAQEYTSLESLYEICVAVPKEFFSLESRLHVLEPQGSRLQMVCSSTTGLSTPEARVESLIPPADQSYETEEACVFPIRGNRALTQWIPFLQHGQVLGMFEIYPKQRVDAKSRFFLEKYTNRIGYNLHQKLLIQQNLNHIKFINQLVADIEHNVISPNLYYKLFLLRLKKSVGEFEKIHGQFRDAVASVQETAPRLAGELEELCRALARNNQNLEEEREALTKHYEHTSLFLETLLRRDHFEKGTYVLRKQSCNFRTEIIQPLLERYLPILEKKNIVVENGLEGVPDDQITLFVDKGLISQVFDNLFSNAVKYAQQVEDHYGHRIKLMSCSRQILPDFFGSEIDGVRFNLFTTGRSLTEKESKRIFDEGFRAKNSAHERGSGHGLHFVRHVVEIHGGVVGCEPQRYGNLFYFVLPLKKQTLTP
ncbi:MAG TPA: ATP-binding protein [Syntrophobacteraceae bacterium]|nr:ATP-binding protein [Syntrophobacteraceae bacterium]